MSPNRTARVLLVEDNDADVRLTREALREDGPPVTLFAVPDGEQALAFLRREHGHEEVPRPDLVLLDLNLPRMNGLEVLEAMRSDPELVAVPVIVLSTSRAERDVAASYERGASCYVVKPIELDDFLATIGSIRSFWLGCAKLPSP